MSTPEVAHRVCVVTGGGAGIGRALCLHLARLGGTVVVADIHMQRAQAVAAEIIASGGKAAAAEVDVTQAEAVAHLITKTVRSHGQIDLLFNNAGVGFWGEARDMTVDDWRRVLDVNLYGVIHGIHAAYPIMIAQRSGHIINMASLAGLIPIPGVAPYAAAKHGVVGLSLSLRPEAARFGVKVSVACLGPVRTDFHPHVLRTYEHAAGPGSPTLAITPAEAAHAILRGVAHNRAIIVAPARARLTWLLYRFSPRSLNGVIRRLIHKLQSTRRESEPPSGRSEITPWE